MVLPQHVPARGPDLPTVLCWRIACFLVLGAVLVVAGLCLAGRDGGEVPPEEVRLVPLDPGLTRNIVPLIAEARPLSDLPPGDAARAEQPNLKECPAAAARDGDEDAAEADGGSRVMFQTGATQDPSADAKEVFVDCHRA